MKILKTVLLLLALLPTLALAQEPVKRQGNWEFGVSGGVVAVDSGLRNFLDRSQPTFTTDAPSQLVPTLGVRLGYHFKHFSVSASGMGARKDGVTYLTPSAALAYSIRLNKTFSPFLLAGTHLTRIDGQNDRRTHSTWGVHAGVGFRYMLDNRLAIRADGQLRWEGYKELFVGTSETRRTMKSPLVTLGFAYFIGGQKPVKPVVQVRTHTIVRVDTLRMTRVQVVRVAVPEIVYVDQVVLRVQFETDKAVLRPESKFVLDTAAKAIIETKDSHWEVQGHTDNVGTAEYNRVLAQNRAQAVADYLVSQGVKRNTLLVTGFGFDRPVFSNNSVYGRAQNRRVQLRRIPDAPTGPAVP